MDIKYMNISVDKTTTFFSHFIYLLQGKIPMAGPGIESRTS
jgi:hypothetical protein